jgi:hypothetical protein
MEALSNPERARRKALEKLQGLTELDDPEGLVVPILIDAIVMAESYRGARHQISFLPELTHNVDRLIRELNIIETTKEWAETLAAHFNHRDSVESQIDGMWISLGPRLAGQLPSGGGEYGERPGLLQPPGD